MKNLDAQTNAFAKQIETELRNGLVTFPTVFDISLRIKRLADDPDVSLAQIADIVQTEPLLSAKLVRMANILAFNPYQSEIRSVKDAISRVGLSTLRCLAFAVAAEQLARDNRSRQMRQIANGLWMHSIDVAAWACAFAHHLKRRDCDSAMLAGMMLNIGQFYLLARAASHPELEANLPCLAEAVMTWEGPVRNAVLEAFEMPQAIIAACAFNEKAHHGWPPSDLGDIVRLATLAAESPSPFESLAGWSRDKRSSESNAFQGIDREAFNVLIMEARETRQALMAAALG